MNDAEKAKVIELYGEGEISEDAARQLLGDEAFEDAREKARGAEQMLSGDTSRYLTNGDENDAEKARVYRQYLDGEATEEDVREVFGDEYDEFEARQKFLSIIENTPTNEPSEDLFIDGEE